MKVCPAICLPVIALLAVGCRIAPADMAMHLPLSNNFNAHICRSSAANTNSVIGVSVAGEVHDPGALELPNGSTILDAIKRAGGFTDFASVRRLVIERRGSRLAFVLCREPIGIGFRNHYRVWYVPAPSHSAGPEEGQQEKAAGVDAVLEPGDCIWVPRCMT